MDDQRKERWFQLCQLASVEQNPDKLLALVDEISSLLEAKERRLKDGRSGQFQKWNQPPETDTHQDVARQPYRGREQDTDDASPGRSNHSQPNKRNTGREPE